MMTIMRMRFAILTIAYYIARLLNVGEALFDLALIVIHLAV
jgi:hypothetical protein